MPSWSHGGGEGHELLERRSAGVALGVVAAWLGHSVETLVAYYVGALDGDELAAMARIDLRLGGTGTSLVLPTASPQTMVKPGQRGSKADEKRDNPDQAKHAGQG